MRLASVNVSLPRLVVYRGATINTGIFKKPVSNAVTLRSLNLDGDRQADLAVHGGPFKAAYAYPVEHYDYWRNELPKQEMPWGMFGENFTTEGLAEGLSEDELHIGDCLRIGSSVVMVRQPRMPCYKLAAKFQRDDMIERFLVSGRSGFYFSVEKEGEVQAGDKIEIASRNPAGITIAEMNRLFFREKYNQDLLQKAIATVSLPDSWRDYLRPRLNTPAMS